MDVIKNTDTTVIVALIAAISAIVSPIITSIINYKLQRNNNLTDSKEKLKTELLKDFVKSYESLPDTFDKTEQLKDIKELSKCFSSAIMLASYYPSISSKLTDFAFLVYAKKVRCCECDAAFLDCIRLIGEEFKKSN